MVAGVAPGVRVRGRHALALAVLSGLGFAAAFPPASRPAAAWVALAPLLVACAVLRPWHAAVAGLCWTVAAAAGVAAFLPGMLSAYFGASAAAGWLGGAAVVLLLHGTWIAAFAAWVAWLAHRGAAHPLLVAAGWVACELARTRGALGGPWALLAHSQVAWTPVIQVADLAGPWGIGFVVAAVNASLAAALAPALRGRRAWGAPLATAALVAATLAYGHWRLARPAADGAPIRVAVVQGGAAASADGARAARLARYAALTASVAPDVDLVVWPEHALDDYLEEPSAARDAVLGLARATPADFVIGGPSYTPSPAGVRYHNSAYLVRGGRVAARYDKHRLVPFAEDDRLAGGAGYAAGTGTFILPGRLLRMATLLCVETMYPGLVRGAVAEGAALLLNLSNDAWFGSADAARQQLAIATLRAVENRRPLVRAAATGFSAIVDPAGRTLARSGFDTREVLTATVRGAHARTVYQRVGDVAAWLLAAGVAGASLWSLLHPPRTTRRIR